MRCRSSRIESSTGILANDFQGLPPDQFPSLVSPLESTPFDLYLLLRLLHLPSGAP